MLNLDKAESEKIIQKVLSYSKADEAQVNLTGRREGNLRFARNAVSTSGGTEALTLSVQSTYGKKSGTATINEFDDASIEKVVRRSEDLANLAPENPEYVEFLGPQTYLAPKAHFDSTAGLNAEFRAKAAADCIMPCKRDKLVSAGFMEHNNGFTSIGNSHGLKGYHRSSSVNYSVTVRTDDNLGSGYGVNDYNDAGKLNAKLTSDVAMQKAKRSADARALEPGKYTVILEPSASVDLISHMLTAMDARQADEGRSFLSKAEGKTRLGEKLVDERINIYTDPMNAEVPMRPWSLDGRPRRRVDWVKDGVVANMAYSRYWAKKKGLSEDKAPPGLGDGFFGRGVAAFEGVQGWVMEGGKASLQELIRDVKRGVLVTRTWYIRPVDPQTLLYTGLTRDGTFYVENGEVKYAIKNFRFNESPVIMLNNVEALGKPVRANGNLVPPMVIRDFTFSSLSDAV